MIIFRSLFCQPIFDAELVKPSGENPFKKDIYLLNTMCVKYIKCLLELWPKLIILEFFFFINVLWQNFHLLSVEFIA